ncbi:hypothetical protein [Halorussus halophilus]|uniref:hypothetical protein n=1 Tax=Halorussus halophilus TaxID=2650975 RepID=UPI0013013386|nr:hypothetical protein [Halorussus halophilus]
MGDSGTAENGDAEEYVSPQLSNGLGEVLRRPREWFFLVENRLVIAGGLLVFALLFFLAVEAVTGISTEEMGPLFYLYSALIGGNLTLITVVLAINQLVISQQLEAPGGLRNQIEGVNEYREAVEETISREVAPVTPSDFLHILLESVRQDLHSFEDRIEEIESAEAREELETLVSELVQHITHVNHLLQQADIGIFNALSVTLQTNYSHQIYEIRAIEAEFGEHISEEITETLDDLVVRIQQIDVARQYFKNLYLQDELPHLSRILLYVGVPAELTAITMLVFFAGTTQAVLGPVELSLLVPVTLTIALAPLAVLFSFVVRVSVVAQHTAAITPFTTSHHDSLEMSEESVLASGGE